MSDQDEGGTKIQRRNVQQIPQQQMNPQQQQQMGAQQMQQQQMGAQQMPQQQQQMPRQMPQQQQQQQVYTQNSIVNKSIPNGIKMGRFNLSDTTNRKNAIIVIVIFVLLNSKIAWRAIARIPMMGSVEPSILSLVVNSLLAGIVFYVLSTNFNKT